MSPDLAKVAIEFMKRVQLTGQEVPAYGAVMSALHQDAAPPKPAAAAPAKTRGKTK